MTISILAHDKATGTFAGACASRTICVGARTLHGRAGTGIVASQGSSPSLVWAEDAVHMMRHELAARDVIRALTYEGPGKHDRQIAMIDSAGRLGQFTGKACLETASHRSAPGVIVIGNMADSGYVLEETLDCFLETRGSLPGRMLAALYGGMRASGRRWGYRSSALLALPVDAPPLDVRVDYSDRPLDELRDMLRRAQASPYAEWAPRLPHPAAPTKKTA